MKKRLSLLLAAVLAMVMIMGMSIMAYAEWSPQIVDCGTDEHKNYNHYYVDTTETYHSTPDQSITDSECVSGWYLQYIDGTLHVYDQRKSNAASHGFTSLNQFTGTLETGWYYETPDEQFHKCPPPVVEAEPSSAAHTHDYHGQTIVEPTKDQDGLESEVCVCGATRNIQRLPAFGYTLQEYATPMVVNAKPGQTVEMDFGELNSFPKSFMEKVAVKTQQNVSFGFHYNWNHVGQEIKIPAGTKVDTNFDWYGPAKMQELYGQN